MTGENTGIFRITNWIVEILIKISKQIRECLNAFNMSEVEVKVMIELEKMTNSFMPITRTIRVRSKEVFGSRKVHVREISLIQHDKGIFIMNMYTMLSRSQLVLKLFLVLFLEMK